MNQPEYFPMPTYVLCQDCELVGAYTSARHLGMERCECGGDFCGCAMCNREAGEKIANFAGVLAHGPSSTVSFSQAREFWEANRS